MPAEKHDFDLRTSVIATQRAFRQSFSSGIKQVGLEFTNLKTRSQEIAAPESAFFSTPIEQRINSTLGTNDLYWPGYELSIDESMTRAIALARRDKMPKVQIKALYAQRDVWRTVRDSALNLGLGESVNYIVPRGLGNDVSQGVSFGQIENKGGQLTQTFQLLPQMSETEIQNFQNAVDQNAQRRSINVNNPNLASGLGWISTGKPIDFKNELPSIIQTAEQPQTRVNSVTNFIAPRDRITVMPSFMTGGGISSQVNSMMAEIHNETGLSLAKNLSAEPVKNAVQELTAEVGVSVVVSISAAASAVFAESLPAVAANLVVAKDAQLVDQPKINASEVVEVAQVKAPELALVENVPNTAVVFFEEKKPKENTKKDDFATQAEVKVTWDNRMIKRFEEATRPAIERVVYDVTYKATEIQSEEQRFEESQAEFHEFAEELETEESILLVDTKEEFTQTDTKREDIFEATVLQEINHYDTAQYHSEEIVKNELPKQVEITAPVVQEQTKKAQPNNFFIPSALLTNYLLWREMFKEGPTENSQPNANREKMGEDELDKIDTQNTSFATKIEQHKTQAKKVKVKTNMAFLSLLLLTKIKLLTKMKLLARKNNLAGFKQLFVTDTLLLFLLNPKLFLVNKSTVAD